jgi:hypothetical protein
VGSPISWKAESGSSCLKSSKEDDRSPREKSDPVERSDVYTGRSTEDV